MEPHVSVLMPAFNAESYIAKAIDSVLAQTYPNFELVVINDGSIDLTAKVVESYSDSRLRLINKPKNEGLAFARNAGLKAAKGRYVAWLDADDFAHPRRLERQVRILERMPLVGLCGSWVRTVGLEPEQTWRYPRRHEYIRANMMFDDPLATSAVMMRRSIAINNGLVFNEENAPAEDYDYWEQYARVAHVINVPQVLAFHRIHESQTSTRDAHRTRSAVRRIQERQLERLGLTLNDSDWEIHELIGVKWGGGASDAQTAAASTWLKTIEEANERSAVYDRRVFRRVIQRKRNMLRMKQSPNALRRLRYKAGAAFQ